MLSLINIIKAIVAGFPTGFIVSLPLGPSGLESVNRSISKGFKEGFKVSLGAVCADLVYLIIINLGLFTILGNHRHIDGLFWIFSGSILILFNKISSNTNDSLKNNRLISKYASSSFLAGFAITFLNPTTPSLWIALSGTVLSIWRINGKIFFIFSIVSMMFGSVFWFFILNILASKGFKTLKSEHTTIASKLLGYLLYFLGIAFIIWGIHKFIF